MKEKKTNQNPDSSIALGVEEINFKKEKIKKKKWWLWVVLGVVIFLAAAGAGAYLYASTIYKSFLPEKTVFENRGNELKTAIKEQNLAKIRESVKNTRSDLERLRSKIQKYAFVYPVPKIGDYYRDANHLIKAGFSGLNSVDLVVEAIAPYADLLGLSGTTSPEGKTTMDRIAFLVTTLDKIRPELDKIGSELETARAEMDKIDPGRYPEEVNGMKLRESLASAILGIDKASLLINDAKPLLEVMPDLMGVTTPKYYFVLFQNDAELRPTGGFMTAYGILKVDKGKITPILSEDIYSLDNIYKSKIEAPEVLVKYIKFPYGDEKRQGVKPKIRLRDMNLSPDFAESIKPFINIYVNQIPGAKKVDGVIAVDTKLLSGMLGVLGSIGVPEWGNFSAEIDKRCDCPQVVYRLEEIADKPISGTNVSRKAVIGPLMHSILANAFNSPKDKIARLVDVGLKSIREKHILLYLFDEKAQKAVEAFNLAGRIKDYDGDYQLLVEANLGGAKSNLFIKEKIDEKIEVLRDGEVTKTITVTYNNPFPASNCNLEKGGLCLNGLYRNWFRLYVPKGSTLIEMNGSEVEAKVYEEAGKTVFEGFYGDKYPLHPQSMTKVTFKYKLPFKAEKGKPYKLLIQKQAGVEKYDLSLEFNGEKQEFELREDKELRW